MQEIFPSVCGASPSPRIRLGQVRLFKPAIIHTLSQCNSNNTSKTTEFFNGKVVRTNTQLLTYAYFYQAQSLLYLHTEKGVSQFDGRSSKYVCCHLVFAPIISYQPILHQ